ncbi:hypothetical protein FOBRF1_009530 [Fusarium oxysporum]
MSVCLGCLAKPGEPECINVKCVCPQCNTGANLEPVGTVPVAVTLAPIPLVEQGISGSGTNASIFCWFRVDGLGNNIHG